MVDQARKHMKDTEFHVYDDIPKLPYDSRKGEMKKFQKAREEGFTAYFSKGSARQTVCKRKVHCPW